MKAISLWQPWASLMAIGAKTIETRHWPTHYRGLLAIHAAKRKVWHELESYIHKPIFQKALWPVLPEPWGNSTLINSLPFGAIVGVVEVFDCQPTERLVHTALPPEEIEFGNWGINRFGWLTRNARKCREPIFCYGRQGFWNLNQKLIDDINAQLD